MMYLGKPVTFKNGIVLKNRICKSALSEQLSDRSHNPTPGLIRLYQQWAQGGAGLLITGNVMLAPDMIGEPKNIVLNEHSPLDTFREWAKAAQSNNCKCFMQLNHPGRQVPNMLALTPKAPSAVAMHGGMRLAFNKPVALAEDEIRDIIRRFALSAKLAKDCGFAGVEIHGAHGYLINQFLSPLQNRRTDQWGGSPENRRRFALEVYRGIRAAVGDDYPIGIKLSSTDAQAGGYSEADALQVARVLDEEGIDFIEVSGGNYESQVMMGSEQKLEQGNGYFVDFATSLKRTVKAPVMLTGGLRNPGFMDALVKEGQCDLIGMGRPFVLEPDLPNRILAGAMTGAIRTPYIKTGIALVDRMLLINITWYEQQLARIARGKSPKRNLSPWLSMLYTLAALGIKGMLPRRA